MRFSPRRCKTKKKSGKRKAPWLHVGEVVGKKNPEKAPRLLCMYGFVKKLRKEKGPMVRCVVSNCDWEDEEDSDVMPKRTLEADEHRRENGQEMRCWGVEGRVGDIIRM